MSSSSVLSVVIVLILFGDTTRGTTADGETTRKIASRGRTRHAHGITRATDGSTDGHGRGYRTMGSIETSLDKIFTFRLGNEGL